LILTLYTAADKRQPPVPADEVAWFGASPATAIAVMGDGTVRTWELPSGKAMRTVQLGGYRFRRGTLAFSGAAAPRLAALVSTAGSSSLVLIALPEAEVQSVDLGKDAPDEIIFGASGSTIICFSAGQLEAWEIDLNTRETLWRYNGARFFGTAANLIQDDNGKTILAFADSRVVGAVAPDGRRLWETDPMSVSRLCDTENVIHSACLVYNESAKRVEARGGWDGRVIWAVSTVLGANVVIATSGNLAHQAVWSAGDFKLCHWPRKDTTMVGQSREAPEFRFAAGGARLLFMPPLQETTENGRKVLRRATHVIKVIDSANAQLVTTIEAGTLPASRPDIGQQ
jgi:hypothetical protein